MKGPAVVVLLAAFVAVALAGNGCPSGQESDWTIEKLLVHRDCDKFYKCTYGRPVEKACPVGLLFNTNTMECDWPKNVDCSNRNQPSLWSKFNAGNGCPSEQESDWTIEKLLVHRDCDKFYKCTYGRPVEKGCPVGLLFNTNTMECDWPKNVDCSNRNHQPGVRY